MSLLTTTDKQKTTTTTEPWSVQQPYLTAGFEAAKNLWGQGGPAYFPGSTVAGFSPDQITAQNMVRDTATAGSPVMDAANQFAYDTLTGQYLNADPYGDSVFQNIMSKVMPSVNSQWMMSGRTPSGEGGSYNYGDTITRALTEAYSPWASQNWQFGMNQMADAMRFAPDLRKMDYFDAGALDTVGRARQDLAQKEADDAKARWDYYQQLPYNKLSDYMGIVGGTNWGGTSTTKTPVEKNTALGDILGIGLGVGGLISGIGSIF